MFSSKKASQRELMGWCLFDFANSAFATVIVTVVYSVYFVNVVAAGRPDAPFLWSIGTFISYGFVFLVSPLLGAMADYSAGKKRFLFVSYLACVIFTALLFFVGQGDILAGLALFILANIAFAIGENFISSFLPEIAAPEEMGRISGYGWAIGYFGGLFSLVLCYPFISAGLDAAHAGRIRWVYPIIAGFFALAGIPTFLWLRSRQKAQSLSPGDTYIGIGFRRIFSTLRLLKRHSELAKFMVVFLVFNCGTAAGIVFASIYAQQEGGLNSAQLMLFFIEAQLAAAVGAFLFGHFQDRWGTRPALQAILLLWTLTILGLYWLPGSGWFILLGNLLGLGMGSIQAASRALVGMLSPVEKSAEFFGFWGLFWKLSNAIGPLIFGWIAYRSESLRSALLGVLPFFVAGFLGMFLVDEKRGREQALLDHSEDSRPG
ncbi:MAG: MFS transporter [Acidobacteria bacterium]|nr:MFS transporter [Acidobacteriota bacterium]